MRLRTLVVFAGCIATPSLVAAQPVTGPYVSLGAGVDFLQNEVRRPAAQFLNQSSNHAFRLDPGPAGFVAAGYGFGNGLRVEIEGDYSNNHIRSFSGIVPTRAGGYQQQYGGFLNALYDFDLGLPVSPYLGIGFGYRQVELDGQNATPAGFTAVNNVRTNGGFAYQAIAGLAYPLDAVPGLALAAEYRFIGVTPLDYRNGSLPINRVTFDDIFSHEILVGARYAFGVAPAAPPPAIPVAAPMPEAARTYLVFFDWDRAALTDRARQIIAEAAQASTRVQTTRIEVNGYTDTSGTPKYNQGLSVRRAEAVEGELVKDGVPKAAISIHGYGETKLLVQTGPGVREPQNRRVEIVLR